MLHVVRFRLSCHEKQRSDLLAILALAGHDLTEHDNTVALHQSDTGETLADLVGLDDQSLQRLEGALSNLVGLEGVRVLELATSVLSELPVDLGQLASRVTSSNESDGRVADLDFPGNIEDLDLGGEVLALLQRIVLLIDHDITSVRHVLLDETLDIAADVVTGLGLIELLVVHFNSEHLTSARSGGLVSGNEDNFLVALNNTLLDSAGQDITDTLDLVDTRDGHSHVGVSVSLGDDAKVVEGVQQSVDVDGLSSQGLAVLTLPPTHLLRGLDEVITHPSGDGEDWDGFINEILLPADSGKHILHLRSDLVVSLLLVSGSVRVHLVDSNKQLLDTQKVNQTSVLSGLTLDLTSLVVTLGNCGGEVTISRNHEKSDIGLRGTGDHILDEISVSRSIDDSVVPLISVELLGSARNGDTSLSLLLLSIHIEGESERRLAQTIGLSLELLELSLVDTAELEEQTTGSGGLTRVDVTADNDRNVLLAVSGHS
jgi:hypothetical protein